MHECQYVRVWRAYLEGVAYEEVISLEVDPVEVEYRPHAGEKS